MPDPIQPQVEPDRRPILAAFTMAMPLVLIAALLAIYFASQDFYLAYVLEARSREHGAVEIITFAALLAAGLMLTPITLRMLRARHEPGGWLAVGVVASLTLASFFVAGEEIDWGDS